MAQLPDNIVYFNKIVAVLFADLYANFPIDQDIDWESVAFRVFGEDYRSVEVGGQPARIWVFRTLKFLRTEGFVTNAHEGARSQDGVTLTSKALSALNSVPGSIAGTKPAGERFKGMISSLGSDAATETVTQLVSFVFGAATKGF